MKNTFIILRRVYLNITGNHCAAKLIEYFKTIYEDLMEEHSRHVIRAAIKLLVDKGILKQQHNPGNGQDRTWQYQLQIEKLEELLTLEHGESVEESGESTTEHCKNTVEQCSSNDLTLDQSKEIRSIEEKKKEVENFPQEKEIKEEESAQPLATISEELKPSVEKPRIVSSDHFSGAASEPEKANQVEEILEKYEERLNKYGIFRQIKTDDAAPLTPNPKIKPVRQALNRVPQERSERAIEAFLLEFKDAKNVKDNYTALMFAILKGNYQNHD